MFYRIYYINAGNRLTCFESKSVWSIAFIEIIKPLLWRHNGRDGVSNHQHHDCLLNSSFRCRSKKTSKLRVTGICAGNSPVSPVDSPHKWPVTRKMLPFDDIIMTVFANRIDVLHNVYPILEIRATGFALECASHISRVRINLTNASKMRCSGNVWIINVKSLNKWLPFDMQFLGIWFCALCSDHAMH